METSLRYARDSKALRIHAKEKIAINSNTLLQVHAELDTKAGAPSYVCAMIRRFYPQIDAALGLGVESDKHERLRYCIRGKKAFPVTNDRFLTFNIKGRCELDKDFKQRNSRAAAEFSKSILNFQRDQNVRIKLGYEILEKVPYMQIREDNWTLNADLNGRWNVRFDL